jgi:tRNA nucleotidyltransferase (CCA-adding enzyme)
MESLGFKPVGRDFPVFLHPETHEEYALARTERKVAPGYHGFTFHASPDVSLEEDLRRRDLTINAMARGVDGKIIDPYGGQNDLKAGVLRHVSEAFGEDPVRILRLARFAARFRFSIAPETMALMSEMVEAGEVSSLVPERVWQEFSKGLMEQHPVLFFEALNDCGALNICLPGCDGFASSETSATQSLQRAANLQLGLPARIAILALCESAMVSLSTHLKWPSALQDLTRLCTEGRSLLLREHWPVESAGEMLRLFEQADAFRRPQRLEEALTGMVCVVPERLGKPLMVTILQALRAARAVDAGQIAGEASDRSQIPILVRAARETALRRVLYEFSSKRI